MTVRIRALFALHGEHEESLIFVRLLEAENPVSQGQRVLPSNVKKVRANTTSDFDQTVELEDIVCDDAASYQEWIVALKLDGWGLM